MADADGLPSVRRIADVAWSGGAVPIVVVSFDPDGAVATALTGAPVTLAEPAPTESGPAGQMIRGIALAMDEIRETDAALIWPARCTWVGPETVTSLVERHGVTPDAVLRPTFDGMPGWPILVPEAYVAHLRAVAPDRMPDDVFADLAARGVPFVELELGDPGVTHDRSTARADLPPYVGPTDPPAGHVHEWGAQAADVPDDAPLTGPALAPYGPAASDTEPG
jgi:CTP:molybdopterin cytidylyltransferase MocA